MKQWLEIKRPLIFVARNVLILFWFRFWMSMHAWEWHKFRFLWYEHVKQWFWHRQLSIDGAHLWIFSWMNQFAHSYYSGNSSMGYTLILRENWSCYIHQIKIVRSIHVKFGLISQIFRAWFFAVIKVERNNAILNVITCRIKFICSSYFNVVLNNWRSTTVEVSLYSMPIENEKFPIVNNL